ncbi:MAG: AmmeMemoRadiSam system protein A [Faecalicatena sp.]|uniref:AmmeMemoRadiSam system protein A n=1 Tax=Faecalicatena sp. TaxID=2005360 RepID=UPI002589339B|nr:AmmeMemoRadiSam system protein A [Faecalicatena sp.]MCI6467512.1 AmmeMemoRadiSam system protein A [Faecalicatena sp.]MDY5619688.1 AmmeMemoRadiSam system protein A [Lachnospiraceae bacterium]
MGIIAAFMVPHPPLIVPDIGRGEERKIQKTINAYKKVAERIRELEPETIVLMSPHQVMYADYFHISPGKGAKGDFGQFGIGQVKMEAQYDQVFVENLCKLADARDLPAGTMGERDRHLDHGTMVPLYFINQYWKQYKLVRIGLSGFPLTKHYELGQCIKETSEILGRKVVLIASGDLSHRLKAEGPYGFQAEGPVYDERIMDVMGRAAFGELFEFPEEFCEKAAECGHRSFTIMAGALDRTEVVPERMSYEGPFGVGYGVCGYAVCGSNPARNFLDQYEQQEKAHVLEQRQQEDAYVQLARRTIEEYIRNRNKIEVPRGLPEEMYTRRAGVFVSIKEEGRLRGCIGTIQAVHSSIAQEIIDNAVSASTCDPRFQPIEEDELDKLTISVDVLGDTEKISSTDELDVKRYGVVVSKGYKRGLLLPNLDGVDTVEEQVAIAKRKAGIGEREEVSIERFEVVRHF